MTEPDETQNAAESPVKYFWIGVILKDMLARKGVQQSQLVDQLVERGVKMSRPTMSRIMSGDRPPTEDELKAICALLGEESQYPRLRTLLAEDEGTIPPQTQQPERQNALHGFLSRPAVTFVLLALAVIGVICAIWLGADRLSRDTDSAGANPPSNTTRESTGGPVAACDQYEVAARDLWLRDEHGAPQTQLPHGQKVTVIHRGSPYWEVTTDDGQHGWVNDNHLKPLC